MHKTTTLALCALATAAALAAPLAASSHREAPAIFGIPQVDGADFYMFRSYEPDREDFVTFIANYNPLQPPYGGPTYFPLDKDAVYDIHVTNGGDVTEELTFRLRFTDRLVGIALPVGEPGHEETVAIPLVNAGPVGPGFGGQANLNVRRGYYLDLIRGPVEAPTSVEPVLNAATGRRFFTSPFDYIGTKSMPDYAAYANSSIHDIVIPGCGTNGRVFLGQRKDPFAVNLGETFDLVNVTNPLGPMDAEESSTETSNITSYALEAPIDCLTASSDHPVIGGWTTSSLPRVRRLRTDPSFEHPYDYRGGLVQVSRLANPLVNEVAIGLPDKNLFNASHPSDDPQFLPYVTNPTLPELLQILFGLQAPNNFPRNDLVWVFLTGIPGLNDDGSVGEVMRLNTAIAPTARDQQHPLGVAAGDAAGYPNGRRPGDDTVDISLRAVMGLLCHLGLGVCDPADAPDGLLPLTDGTLQDAFQFDNVFPYVTTPIPGSPNATP